MNYHPLEAEIGYTFQNPELLLTALTHTDLHLSQ